jgi:hypothetical protein
LCKKHTEKNLKSKISCQTPFNARASVQNVYVCILYVRFPFDIVAITGIVILSKIYAVWLILS